MDFDLIGTTEELDGELRTTFHCTHDSTVKKLTNYPDTTMTTQLFKVSFKNSKIRVENSKKFSRIREGMIKTGGKNRRT